MWAGCSSGNMNQEAKLTGYLRFAKSKLNKMLIGLMTVESGEVEAKIVQLK